MRRIAALLPLLILAGLLLAAPAQAAGQTYPQVDGAKGSPEYIASITPGRSAAPATTTPASSAPGSTAAPTSTTASCG